MSTSIVLLADDLSGALDSAVPFRLDGRKVAVAVDIDAVDEAMATAPEIVAINLDCRSLASDRAATTVRSLAPMLASIAPRIVMLKIDSRMKGPVAALIEAALTASGRCGAIVCPAVPDMARFVVKGRIVGTGVDWPIEVAPRIAASPDAICRDADSAATMRTVAVSIVDRSDALLAVGARGFAQALAAVTASRPTRSASPADWGHSTAILAIGSRDPITAEQVDRVSRERDIVDGRALLRGDPQAIDGAVVLIRAPDSGIARDPAEVAAGLADDVARIVCICGGAMIVASGGDTAMAVARRLGSRVLLPVGELAPGVPISRDASRADLLIATKSGGFGDRDTLVRCLGSVVGQSAPTHRMSGGA